MGTDEPEPAVELRCGTHSALYEVAVDSDDYRRVHQQCCPPALPETSSEGALRSKTHGNLSIMLL